MRITAVNAEDVSKRLTLYGKRIGTWRSLWRTIARDIARAQIRWFDSEGNGRWPKLSPTYAAAKAVMYPGKPILVAEGDLRAAATDAARLVDTRGASSMTVKIDDPKAAYHGGRGTRSKIPFRDPFMPTANVRSIIRKALEAHVRYRRGIPGPKPR